MIKQVILFVTISIFLLSCSRNDCPRSQTNQYLIFNNDNIVLGRLWDINRCYLSNTNFVESSFYYSNPNFSLGQVVSSIKDTFWAYPDGKWMHSFQGSIEPFFDKSSFRVGDTLKLNYIDSTDNLLLIAKEITKVNNDTVFRFIARPQYAYSSLYCSFVDFNPNVGFVGSQFCYSGGGIIRLMLFNIKSDNVIKDPKRKEYR